MIPSIRKVRDPNSGHSFHYVTGKSRWSVAFVAGALSWFLDGLVIDASGAHGFGCAVYS